MVLSNQTDDSFSLINSISLVELCDKILTADHPEWNRKSRVSRRMALDYSSPTTWNSDTLKIGSDYVMNMWEIGRLEAYAILLKLGLNIKEKFEDKETSMKRPLGKLVG